MLIFTMLSSLLLHIKLEVHFGRSSHVLRDDLLDNVESIFVWISVSTLQRKLTALETLRC
jgi:hypothetical protein